MRKGELAYLEHWGSTTPESIFRIYAWSGIFMIQNMNDLTTLAQFKALAYQAIID